MAAAALVALPMPEGRRWAALAKRSAMVVSLMVFILGTHSLFVAQVVEPLTVGPEQATYVADLAGISVREDEMLIPEVDLQPEATLDQLRWTCPVASVCSAMRRHRWCSLCGATSG